jgi:hypothetical protein
LGSTEITEGERKIRYSTYLGSSGEQKEERKIRYATCLEALR